MKHNKKKLTVVFLIVLIILLLQPVYAESDGLFPSIKDITDSNLTPTYEKYDIRQYYFDYKHEDGSIFNMEGMVDNIVNTIFNSFSSGIFMFLALICRACIFIFTCCFKVSVFDMFPDIIDKVVLSIKSSFFDLFLNLVVTAAGIYGIYKHIKGKQTATIQVVITLIVVLGFANIYFASPSQAGKAINKGSEAICTAILYGTVKTAGNVSGNNDEVSSSNDAVVLIGNYFWELNIMKPYAIIQYGSVNHNPEEFLSTDNDKRKELAKNYAKTNSMFTIGGAIIRLAVTLLMLIVGLINCVLLLAVAVVILINQCGALVWFGLAGVFILFAIHPKNGIPFLVNWGWKCIGFEFKKIIITMLLSIYFGISLVVYGLADKYGLLFCAVFNICLLAYMVYNHGKIYEMLSEPILNMLGEDGAEAGGNNKGSGGNNKGSKLKDSLKRSLKTAVMVKYAMDRQERRNQKKFNRENKDHVIDHLNDQYVRDKGQSQSAAKKKLSDRYFAEKREADERAKRTGNPPEYSQFVNNAMANENAGKPMFTEQQLDEASNYSDFVREVDERKKTGLFPFSDERISSTLDSMYKFRKEGVDPKTLSLLGSSAMNDMANYSRTELPDLNSKLERKQRINQLVSTDVKVSTKKGSYTLKQDINPIDSDNNLAANLPDVNLQKDIKQQQAVNVTLDKRVTQVERQTTDIKAQSVTNPINAGKSAEKEVGRNKVGEIFQKFESKGKSDIDV